MKYKLIERANPQEKEAKKKWYASPVQAGKPITLDELAKVIAGRSSLTRGDVTNVLLNVTDELPMYLMKGYSVQLGNFGTLRLSFSSEGVENPDDFTIGMIRDIKIIFTASTELKAAIERISFEAE